jgi:hypothetical protein
MATLLSGVEPVSIEWIASDGQLRTDSEIMAEMISVLGFSRRGARIETAIKSALQAYGAVQSPPSTSSLL